MRVHVITLGVQDINRSLRFYRDGLGFSTTVAEDDPPIVFFQSQGVTLALCPRAGLAEDIDKENPPQGTGFSGTTLDYVVKEKDEVERVLALAESAGGSIKSPQKEQRVNRQENTRASIPPPPFLAPFASH